MPTELELIALETEFDLYLTFTKRLVLNLPDSDDRTRAALWLQKLRSIDDDDHKKLRNEHLKLLLFALHRRSLLGVFEKAPPEELESFHDGLTLLEMTRELIELTEKKMASGDNSVDCPLPPVSTNISADLKEYGASQQIPKFGAHVYYAISNEPIQMWSKSANCVYPASSDVPNPLQWELTLSKLTDHVLEKQAEADRLAAEAEKGDKTEMIKDDDTHILPRIEVPAKEEAPFKWKADSILILHQNYDFSEVGAAEDLDEQGKLQLELDEMAFGILDHSLPGRQKVVIREPYYKGMPPDLPERRHHGVVEEISSSSSESLDGAAEMGFHGSTNSAQMRKDSGQSSSAAQSQDYEASFINQYETSGSASQNFSAAMTKLGPLAQKYLSNETDFLYGLHFDKACNIFKVGNNYAFLEGDDILVNYGDDSNFDVELVRYNGTEGLWRLLTQNEDFNEEPPIYFTDADWVVFMDMLIATNRSPFNSMISTFCLFYWANGIFWGFPKELTTSSPPPQPEVGKPDQGYGVLGQMGDKVYQVIEEASKNPDHFWESLGCMDCVYLKEMDELIRMYAFRVRKVPDENSSFDNNCILFWIMERMFMLLARENGLEKVLSWLKINETLIVESGLLRTMARKLPWGLELSGTRPSKMQNDGDQREMFSKYVEVDENYINGQVIEGLNALDKIFQDTPDIFLEAKMIFTDISNDRLHLAFESALKFFRQFYSGC